MNSKDLFKSWAPSEAYEWTKFAKPALFVHEREVSFARQRLEMPEIPDVLLQYCSNGTAFIVDLPGAASVGGGLALARLGYRPVPLYNGIHERNIGGLRPVIDNQPIVDGLYDGVNVLESLVIENSAPPAFMLDYKRNDETAYTFGMYDNRWSIELDDMPTPEYMRNAGIIQVVIWTNRALNTDLLPILDSYHDAGIELSIFCNEQVAFVENPVRWKAGGGSFGDSSFGNSAFANAPLGNGGNAFDGNPLGSGGSPFGGSPLGGSTSGDTGSAGTEADPRATLLREEVRKFENGRFALMLIAGMALVNFVFMFFFIERPILWTAPSIMWVTYLWIPEILGDGIAIAMTIAYLVFYFLSQRKRILMRVALIVFGIDVGLFFMYVLYYGVADFAGGSMFYGLVVFGFPVFCLIIIIRGAMAFEKLRDINDTEYYTSLDNLDGIVAGGVVDEWGYRPVVRRRHFRGFRGYGGYGGSGRGGYRGGGYRGYGGGYGGGFGG